ncbi:MAG TPA: hypothetical protein VNN79_23505 [Actinomycetota bacterium]|nr:hypothetical protein [Actinomycetota bacterium]
MARFPPTNGLSNPLGGGSRANDALILATGKVLVTGSFGSDAATARLQA